MGVSPEDTSAVLATLKSHRVKSWGFLVAIETKDKLVKYVDDEVTGVGLWAYLESYRNKQNPPEPKFQPAQLKVLVKAQLRGFAGFVSSEVAEAKRVRLEELGKQERVIALSKKLWGSPTAPHTLYLRPCYSYFAQRALAQFKGEKGEVMVAGTWGTGKSVFGLLMVLELVESGNCVMYEHKREKMLIIGSNADPRQVSAIRECCEYSKYLPVTEPGVYSFQPDDQGVWHNILQDDLMIHIQDLGDDRSASIIRSSNCRKLILTSPNNEQLSQQHNNVGLLILYMPLWSLEELKEARSVSFPHVNVEDLEEAFRLYGGVPRVVLEMDESQRKDALQLQLQRVTIADLCNIFRTAAFIDLPHQKTTSLLVHLVPKRREESDSKNEYEAFQCVFASEPISKKLAERFIQDQSFSVQGFAASVQGIKEFAAWRGYMLEAYAHRHLPLGGTYKVMKLAGEGKTLTEWHVPPMEITIPPFKDIHVLGDLKPGCYLRPERTNYPTLDALAILEKSQLYPEGIALIIFQFTKSKSHTLDGSVIKRVQKEVAEKLESHLLALASSSGNRKQKSKKQPELRTFLVFGTVRDGISKAQPLSTSKGEVYKYEPKFTQYAMIMDDKYHEIFQLFQPTLS